MWSLFKRNKPEAPTTRVSLKTVVRRRNSPTSVEAFAAATEVHEGNADADWEAWENSVLLRDSQLVPEAPPSKTGRKLS